MCAEKGWFAGLAGVFGWQGCGAGVEGETEKFRYPPINRFSLNTLGETNSEKAIDMG